MMVNYELGRMWNKRIIGISFMILQNTKKEVNFSGLDFRKEAFADCVTTQYGPLYKFVHLLMKHPV